MEGLSETGKMKRMELLGKVTKGWKSENRDENGNAMSFEAVAATFQLTTLDWNSLEERILMKLFSFVNYLDLLQCRLVSQRFHKLISSSPSFLQTTLFVKSVKLGFDASSSISSTSVPFENTRFEHIDYDVFMNAKKFDELSSGNYYFRPPSQFLVHLKSIEFQNCFITWETIKRVLTDTPKLERLALSRCKFIELKPVSVLSEFDEYRVGKTFSHLKAFKISEYVNDLKPMNKILGKFLGYCNTSLEELHIAFDPEEDSPPMANTKPNSFPERTKVETADMEIFCNIIRQLVELNSKTLKTLNLDIKHQEILDCFLPSVIACMEEVKWNELKLEGFLLSPPGCSPSPKGFEISQNSIVALEILTRFLESQVHLKKVALPHFRNLGSSAAFGHQGMIFRERLGQSLPTCVEYLCVPNQEYLPEDFLARFPSLTKLFVGGSTGDDQHPVALKSDMFDQGRESEVAWDRFKELGLGSTIVNGIELMKTIQKFHLLTKFEVTSQLPVMQDEDLQSIIGNMQWLQSLSINACDYITDFGVTGIMRNSCEMLVRLGNYEEVTDAILDGRNGKPLSTLKGLRTLMFMKNSHITDVGLHFGFRFKELQTVCLPFNENITEWGLQKFGENNPSLQTLVMCSINQSSEEGFVQLQSNHPRVKSNKCTYLSYTSDTRPNDFSNSMLKFDVLKNSFSTSMSGMCSTSAISWFFGKKEKLPPASLTEEGDQDQQEETETQDQSQSEEE